MKKNKNSNNVNNNDEYFGNSVSASSSPHKSKTTLKHSISNSNIVGTFTSNLFSSLSDLRLNSINKDKNNSNNSDDDDDEDNDDDVISGDENYENQDHYKDDFFSMVSKKSEKKEMLESNNNNNNSNSNNNDSDNDNNIVLINPKNYLQPPTPSKQNEKNSLKTKKKKVKKLIEYDKANLEYTLNRLKDNSIYCGNEFSKLLLSVNTICNNITKLSSDNMENYSNIIDKTNFESLKSAEQMKTLINNMELLNSDMFEMYKLYNEIKNVKKGVDQLEILMKTLIN